MYRRTVLAVVGATGSFVLGGCVLDLDPVQAGTLVIDNEHDQAHTVTVVVSKTSESDEDIPPGGATPTTAPLWKRESTFEVPAGGRVRKSEFVTEPGAFYIEVRTEMGETAATWFGLYPAGPEGEQVAEGYIAVDIYEDGRLNVSTPVDD